MAIPLEDFYEDILSKAQRGLGLSDASICRQAGISTEAWRKALEGGFDEAIARALAPVLGLGADALAGCGRAAWEPTPIELPGLRQFNTPFGDMRVNAYLVWHPDSLDAVVFDSGADAGALITAAQDARLKVRHIFLTHTHPDHIEDLPRLREAFPEAPVAAHRNEPVAGADSFDEGAEWCVQGLHIKARHTPGHSPGGTTFVIDGLEQALAVVGDALFAGSMGGAPQAWQAALTVNRDKILSLDSATILCPGHGPVTTVAWEAAHNPFYATP